MNNIHLKKFNNTLLKRDINEQVEQLQNAALNQALNQTKQHKEVVQALLKSSRAILGCDNFQSAARVIFETCKDLIGASAGYVALSSEEEDDNHVVFLNSGGAQCTVDPTLPMPIRGLRELAYQTNSVVYDNEFSVSQWDEAMPTGHMTLTNVMFIPLIIHKKAVGLIGIANKPGGFSETDSHLASVFGEFAAIALYNGRLLESLKESEERYRSIFDSVDDAVVVFETETGCILEMNDQACQLFNYSKEELKKFKIQDLLSEKKMGDREAITAMIKLSEKDHRQISEWSTKDKEGNLVWIEVNLRRAVISGKSRILGVLRNITARKQLEREIAQIDRLNTVSRIAAGIAHEIRNPMTTVKGFLQLMCFQEDASPQLEKYSKLMIEELDRANAIITEFLSIVKDKAVELKVQDLNQVLRALIPLIQTKAIVQGKEVEVFLEEVPSFPLNEQEIKQLVLNLIRNALEAMEPGGKVKIKTYANQDNEVMMIIKDEGRGISPEILGKLGTPFFTTKDGGTGLGIAICNGIASRHNAKISFDSDTSGTTVEVRFKRVSLHTKQE